MSQVSSYTHWLSRARPGSPRVSLDTMVNSLAR